MGNPFIYPKTKHKRTQSPPAFTNYRSYKPALQLEFERQCVYCRGHDNKGYETFGVDHYRPKKHFPELINEYLNLYYACNRCNAFKREYWPTPQQMKVGQYIPNPCEYVMFEHLKYKKGEVVPVSSTGQFCVDQLDLNSPEAVQYREGIVSAIELAESELAKHRNTIIQIESLQSIASEHDEMRALADRYSEVKENMRELERMIVALGG